MTSIRFGPLTVWRHALLAAIVFCGSCALAATLAIPPRGSQLVIDPGHSLGDEARTGLEVRLTAVESTRMAKIAVLITTDTGDESPAQYAARVTDTWQLGHKGEKDGVLILIVRARSLAHIEVGADLKTAIPAPLGAQWASLLSASLNGGHTATALDTVVGNMLTVIPKKQRGSGRSTFALFDQHPEWKLPFVLAIFSPVAIFLLLAGTVGAFLSAALLAAVYGFIGMSLTSSNAFGYAVGAITFPLPLLWRLNFVGLSRLSSAARVGLIVGNLCAVALFFTFVTLLVGLGMFSARVKELWAAPLFGLLMATGLAVFLFSGPAQRYLMGFLRSLVHFIFALAVAYFALVPSRSQATELAVAAATLFTGLTAAGLFLDYRDEARAAVGQTVAGRRWGVWFFTVAILFIAPFTVITLYHAVF